MMGVAGLAKNKYLGGKPSLGKANVWYFGDGYVKVK